MACRILDRPAGGHPGRILGPPGHAQLAAQEETRRAPQGRDRPGLVLGISRLFLPDAADHAGGFSLLARSRRRLRRRWTLLRLLRCLFAPVATRKARSVFLDHPPRSLPAP